MERASGSEGDSARFVLVGAPSAGCSSPSSGHEALWLTPRASSSRPHSCDLRAATWREADTGHPVAFSHSRKACASSGISGAASDRAHVLVTNLLEPRFPSSWPCSPRRSTGARLTSGSCTASGEGRARGRPRLQRDRAQAPAAAHFPLCFAFVPLGYLVLATLPSLPVALAALAVFGVAAGPINPLLFTVVSEIVPTSCGPRLRAVRAGAWAAIPLGVLLGASWSLRRRRSYVPRYRVLLVAVVVIRLLQPGVPGDGSWLSKPPSEADHREQVLLR